MQMDYCFRSRKDDLRTAHCGISLTVPEQNTFKLNRGKSAFFQEIPSLQYVT